LLKIIAIIIGFLIVALILLKRLGVGIGIRVTQNIFSEQIANMSVYSWLLGFLILFELLIVAFLVFSSKRRI
jgi:hypothetical protein